PVLLNLRCALARSRRASGAASPGPGAEREVQELGHCVEGSLVGVRDDRHERVEHARVALAEASHRVDEMLFALVTSRGGPAPGTGRGVARRRHGYDSLVLPWHDGDPARRGSVVARIAVARVPGSFTRYAPRHRTCSRTTQRGSSARLRAARARFGRPLA